MNYLNEDTLYFGMKDRLSKVYRGTKSHVGKHKMAYAAGGTTAAGTAIGAIIANRRAKRLAKEQGLEGEAANRLIKRETVKGAAIGGATAATGFGLGLGIKAGAPKTLKAAKSIRERLRRKKSE